MAEQTLTEQLQGLGRRVGALEEEQSNPDSITRITKAYGNLQLTVTVSYSIYTFRRCSDSLACSDSLII